MGLAGFVTGVSRLHLLEESLTLICRIVQLGKSISQLSTSNVKLKAVHPGRVRVIFSRQRGNFQWIPGYERRLDQVGLGNVLEYVHQKIAIRDIEIDVQAFLLGQALQSFKCSNFLAPLPRYDAPRPP